MSFLTPGDLPDPGIKLENLISLALTGRLFTTVPFRNPFKMHQNLFYRAWAEDLKSQVSNFLSIGNSIMTKATSPPSLVPIFYLFFFFFAVVFSFGFGFGKSLLGFW